MNKKMKKIINVLLNTSLVILIFIITGCAANTENIAETVAENTKEALDVHVLNLNGNVATLDGKKNKRV